MGKVKEGKGKYRVGEAANMSMGSYYWVPLCMNLLFKKILFVNYKQVELSTIKGLIVYKTEVFKIVKT